MVTTDILWKVELFTGHFIEISSVRIIFICHSGWLLIVTLSFQPWLFMEPLKKRRSWNNHVLRSKPKLQLVPRTRSGFMQSHCRELTIAAWWFNIFFNNVGPFLPKTSCGVLANNVSKLVGSSLFLKRSHDHQVAAPPSFLPFFMLAMATCQKGSLRKPVSWMVFFFRQITFCSKADQGPLPSGLFGTWVF